LACKQTERNTLFPSVNSRLAAERESEGKQFMDKMVVLVTCRSIREANRIACALVESRLAACGNILQSPVRSVYRWKEKVETAKEFLLVIKTSRPRFPKLQAEIQRLHSYEVPEIIALPISAGSRGYLSWLGESVAPSKKRKRIRR
jgi:periplasmic divalent cation tolerance protein